jgi:predicted HAD superfamily Cof-like phosphohydrolase
MQSLGQQVEEFNHVYAVASSDEPRLPTRKEAERLYKLVEEELDELEDAILNNNLVEVADAITDLIYVIAQQGTVIGLPIDALLREVHRSNMSKLGADGKPIYRKDGKVLKGPNFSEPDIAGVLVGYCKGNAR